MMDLDAVGCHILLMCAAGAASFRHKFPYDRDKIRRLFRNPSDEDFERIMSQLLDGAWKVSEDGEWLVQEGMRRTMRKQREFSKKQSDNAKKRWESQKDAKPIPKKCQTDTKVIASSSSSSSNIYIDKSKKEFSLKDIQPSELDRLAKDPKIGNGDREWLDRQIKLMTDRYKGQTRSDWLTQIETWCLKARKFGDSPGLGAGASQGEPRRPKPGSNNHSSFEFAEDESGRLVAKRPKSQSPPDRDHEGNSR